MYNDRFRIDFKQKCQSYFLETLALLLFIPVFKTSISFAVVSLASLRLTTTRGLGYREHEFIRQFT